MRDKGWSPYLAGALSGVVSILSVALVGKFLGASTTFVRAAGKIESLFAPDRVAEMQYYVDKGINVDWQWMFVVGVLLGSFIAAVTSRTFRWQAVPDMWERRFGLNRAKRGLVAFMGGVIAIFGARLAGGCPSGHGLSGTLQLAVSGYIALICFFVGGIVVAHLLYGRREEG